MNMHFVFVDITYGYTSGRPDQDEPLGGMTSAICFLAREMVKAGIQCTFVNRVEAKTEEGGIPSYPLNSLASLCADPSVSAFIFCGRWQQDLVLLMRPLTRVPFIAWMHEACFEMFSSPPMEAFDGAVFVSMWQAKVNAPFVNLRWQQAIIRNALNPRFVNLFAPKEPITAAKETPPLILFIGDYPRGAAHLTPILNSLRSHDPNFVFEAYTGPRICPDASVDVSTLELLSQHPNVRHVGKVGQTRLAACMKKASILLAPNAWPETSCINLIQAMAAGMLCVTTNRAALPESSHGFGHLLPVEETDHLVRYDQPLDTEAFAKTLAFLLKIRREHGDVIEARLQEQRSFFLEHYQWSTRVEPWVEFVKRFT